MKHESHCQTLKDGYLTHCDCARRNFPECFLIGRIGSAQHRTVGLNIFDQKGREWGVGVLLVETVAVTVEKRRAQVKSSGHDGYFAYTYVCAGLVPGQKYFYVSVQTLRDNVKYGASQQGAQFLTREEADAYILRRTADIADRQAKKRGNVRAPKGV